MNEHLKTSYKILLRDNPSTNCIKLMVMYKHGRITQIGNLARMTRIAYES